ncbi:hypothetical protein AGOR_G00098070 [Albula goreensis]|uniref:Uncharacterized protein n=1 Tax=Albula goreensis TaxID=1534307 RepID=A0A8T3DLM7_9TELE|nr:hypothetical protein AGOR_G00098070 [Albula goreensis]
MVPGSSATGMQMSRQAQRQELAKSSQICSPASALPLKIGLQLLRRTEGLEPMPQSMDKEGQVTNGIDSARSLIWTMRWRIQNLTLAAPGLQPEEAIALSQPIRDHLQQKKEISGQTTALSKLCLPLV